jgi:hypothetical protein
VASPATLPGARRLAVPGRAAASRLLLGAGIAAHCLNVGSATATLHSYNCQARDVR